MGWFDGGRDDHDQVYGYEGEHHEAKFSHEALAGGASFAAMKIYEDRQRKEGKEVKHAFAKEAIAAIAGAEVDKLAETYGRDKYDQYELRKQAGERSAAMYDEHYGQRGDTYDSSYSHDTYRESRDVDYSRDNYRN